MIEDARGGGEPVGLGRVLDRKAYAKRRLAAALRANLRRRKAPSQPDDPAVVPASPDRDGRAVDGRASGEDQGSVDNSQSLNSE